MAPKIFCVIMVALMILSFGRALLGNDPLSIDKVLTVLQEFKFTNTRFYQDIEKLASGSLVVGFHEWNDELGFFENLSLWISSFFTFLIDFVAYLVTAIVDFFLSVMGLGFAIWKLAFTLFGII